MSLIPLPLGSSEPASQIHLKPMTEAQGQDQLRKAFQAPSYISSAHIQAAQVITWLGQGAGKYAHPFVEGIPAPWQRAWGDAGVENQGQ